MEKAIHINSLR